MSTTDQDKHGRLSRRSLLQGGLAAPAGPAAAGLGLAATRGADDGRVWQLDPDKCMQCGNCETACVLAESAVKCVHAYAKCGYCDLCFGYFVSGVRERTTDVENQICPTGAIVRTFVEDPYYQYTIDESLCIGCGECVKQCEDYGNGSLFLQVRHDRCLNCNECAIARKCPAQAFARVPAEQPYIMKQKPGAEDDSA